MDQTIHRLSRIVLDPSFPHTPVFNADLIRVLFGSHPPSTLPVEEWARRLATDGSKDVVQGGLTYFDETLNDSQKKAVEFALAAREVAAIHGPPGVGLCFTVPAWRRAFMWFREC
jgi:DNA polymerase alpha-associated DNA helicase A